MVDSFGEALRELRLDRGWSLAQLAAKVRWSKPVVGAVEIGKQNPTLEFAKACDEVFGSTPILTTLCGLTGEDDDVKRRALLGGFAAAVGVGAMTSYAAMAETIRLQLQDAAGVDEDWDAVIASYQDRYVTEPDHAFGDELLASMLTARQQMSERRSPDAVRASAHLGLIYGLWMGNLGNIGTGQNFYRTAQVLAERSGDPDTHIYVLARTAAGGPFQGLSRARTQECIDKALALANGRVCTGALEAHAATVQLAGLTGDLAAGRQAVKQMWDLADRLPATTSGAGPAQRTVSFHAYLEGSLGSLDDAHKARDQADLVLAHLPQWHAETRLYWALALIRHGLPAEGVSEALNAARTLHPGQRVYRLGVNNVLLALPEGYRSDQVDQLRSHATTGTTPWELVRA